MNPPPAVEIAGLTHRYPDADRPALDGLDLTVAAGQTFALLGPNGSGKSTAFRILATLLAPGGSGRVEVFGHCVRRHPGAVRRELGAVFQNPSLDVKLSARENLACHARLYGLSRRDARPRVDEALERFGLAQRQNQRVETFSGGMCRKLEIAKALLHQPRLLLMDEPATGLDPAARRELWDHLRQLNRSSGVTVVWTTHLMDEAEGADQLAVMSRGRLLATSSPADLKASLAGHVVVIEPLDDRDLPTIAQEIRSQMGKTPAVSDSAVRFEHNDGPAVVARVAEMFPQRLRRISVGQPTLEDAYLRLTGHGQAGPAAPEATAV